MGNVGPAQVRRQFNVDISLALLQHCRDEIKTILIRQLGSAPSGAGRQVMMNGNVSCGSGNGFGEFIDAQLEHVRAGFFR